MNFNSFSVCLVLCAYFVATTAQGGGGGPLPVSDGPTVKRDERVPIMSSEFGDISAVKVSNGENGFYHLHFITLNAQALFLPVYLHSEMLFYVNSGNGTLSWMNTEKGDKLEQVNLEKGVLHRLSPETIFYIQNDVQSESYSFDQPQPLQIYAIFPHSAYQLQKEQQVTASYTSIQDLVLGFDNEVLKATLSVPEPVIEELRMGEKQPLIVDGQADTSMWDTGFGGPRGIRAFLRTMDNDILRVENKNKKKKAYNIFREDRDVETCFGWSVTVTQKELDVLKDTNFGVSMVYLTKGSMVGPHWNPKTGEVGIVLQGQGMIQVGCNGVESETGCKDMKLKVEEGDVFVVPRDYPMAQMSFNYDSFVFLEFMLKSRNESPKYIAGKLSILQKLDRNMLQKSFNVRNTTIDLILNDRREKVIYECISCAEEEATSQGGGGQGWQQEEEGRGGQGWPPQKEGRGGQGWPPQEEGRGGQGWPPKQEGTGGQGGGEGEEGRGGQGWPPQEEGRGGQGWPPLEEGRGGQGWPPQEEGRGGQGWPPQEMGTYAHAIHLHDT